MVRERDSVNQSIKSIALKNFPLGSTLAACLGEAVQIGQLDDDRRPTCAGQCVEDLRQEGGGCLQLFSNRCQPSRRKVLEVCATLKVFHCHPLVAVVIVISLSLYN